MKGKFTKEKAKVPKEIVIPNGKKIADKISRLPAGFIYKDETGMGATTLELKTQRHSIIVEPIKVTASSKAVITKDCLYVGSETKKSKKVTKQEIVDYLKNPAIQFKKIIVVADSLQKLMDALASINTKEYKKYFLLLDEIDSFQLDSSFRNSMENCLDIYKSFPKTKRAMLSATEIPFSDPDIQTEPLTHIRYDKPNARQIDLKFTDNLKGAAFEVIKNRLLASPNDKVMVAYNSVSGACGLAEHLVNNQVVSVDEVKVMCSIGSKDKAGNYFVELEDDMLPAKVTFVTSAYFTGFDLHERFHLLSMSGNGNSIHSLSEHRLKQIAGRCRNGVLSETILYDLPKYREDVHKQTVQSLIATATREINALECISKQFYNDPLLKQQLEEIRKIVVEKTEFQGCRFVRINSAGKNLVSYLNIDSYLEGQRLRNELYSDKSSLPSKLKNEGHNVTVDRIISTLHIAVDKTEKASRQQQIIQVVEKLRALKSKGLPVSSLDLAKPTSLQTAVINGYGKLHEYIDPDQLLAEVEDIGKKKADMRAVKNLFASATFAALDSAHHIKRSMAFHLEVGKEYTRRQLIQKWNAINDECSLGIKVTGNNQAVQTTKLQYKTLTVRVKGTSTRTVNGLIRIVSENPQGFKLLKYMDDTTYVLFDEFFEKMGIDAVEMDV